MKNLIVLLSVFAISISACKNSSTNSEAVSEEQAQSVNTETRGVEGRYDFKSGILETQTEMMGMGNANIKTTFEGYGKTQLIESTVSMEMMGKKINTSTRSLIKDGFLYTWAVPSMGAATKMRIEEGKFDDKNIDFKNLTKEMRDKFQIKEIANETIDGKDCKVFSFSVEGMNGKSYVWKGLPIQSEMSVSGHTIKTRFVRFEETDVPSSAFELPADVTFNEMQAPATAAK
ncbi:MAG: hypothetical protein IPM95_15125 [Sphingobacteriales bacterium]|jgi:hypothetical protein|nr:hypothetical protein [Sphingobacteriales bacterium]